MKIFSGFCIAIISFFSWSCSSETIWDIDTDIFTSSIQHGDTDFLRHLDYSKIDLDEIFELGPGAALSLAVLFEDIGMDELVTESLRLEWVKGIGLWRRHAGETLIDRLLDGKEYEAARKESELYVREYSGRYFGYRRLISALYWQQKDREVLDLLDRLRELFPEESGRDGELFLFEAVSSSRLELPEWDELFYEMFQDIPSSGPLIRGYKYIIDSQRLSEYFSEDELKLFNARVFTATGRYSDAADLYLELLTGVSPVLSSEMLYDEIGTVFLHTNQLTDGAELLISHTQGHPFFYGYFSAGRLLRAAGQYNRAYELFQEAAAYTEQDQSLYKRNLWYGLDCLLKQDPRKLIEEIPKHIEAWDDPAYYADLLEETAVRLTGARKWKAVWELYRILQNGGDGESAALFGNILLQAEGAGLFVPPYDEEVPNSEEISKTVQAYHPYGYYHLLVFSSSDDVPAVFRKLETDPGGGPSSAAASQEAEFVSSFFFYSLYKEAYRYALMYQNELSNDELVSISEKISEAGLFREAITLLNTGTDRNSWVWSDQAFHVLFPKAYTHLLHTEAEKNGIDVSVFSALVREESYFDPFAVSHAGAVGLSQLMPATAEDTARRMRTEDPDLYDPGDNLSIGAYYFGSLLKRFNGIPLYAVCAYNAGPTRMRRWDESYGSLPLPLLVEAIPIKETRNHAKKVLVSSVLYGYLYEGTLPHTTIQNYFSGKQ